MEPVIRTTWTWHRQPQPAWAALPGVGSIPGWSLGEEGTVVDWTMGDTWPMSVTEQVFVAQRIERIRPGGQRFAIGFTRAVRYLVPDTGLLGEREVLYRRAQQTCRQMLEAAATHDPPVVIAPDVFAPPLEVLP